MVRFKVVMLERDGSETSVRYRSWVMEALAALPAEVLPVTGATEDETVDIARDADALIADGLPITRRIIDNLEHCRIIALGMVGVDSVDIDAATSRAIPVTNVPDTFIEEVADHTLMLILAVLRRVLTLDRFVRTGRWRDGRPVLLQYPRLMGQTLGLIGFGNVARAVAMRAKGFGVRILAFDPYVRETVFTGYGVEPASLAELLHSADIVSMHAPATAATHHLLGESQFRSMKPGALFINTGRGATVDEQALHSALREGRIAAAGLDVLEQEPPAPTNPLLTLENVIFTPHVASASARMDPVRWRRVGQEVASVLTGRQPMNCVNPSVLTRTGHRQ